MNKEEFTCPENSEPSTLTGSIGSDYHWGTFLSYLNFLFIQNTYHKQDIFNSFLLIDICPGVNCFGGSGS